MTTATLATGNRTMTEARPRRSLEELVDRLMAALFSEQPETAPATAPATETPSVAKSVHEARRLRQAGDVGGALAVLAGMDTTKAEAHSGSVGLRRVDGPGSAAVRGPGRRWSTARARDGPPPWFPGATGRLRSRRCWGCAGEPGKAVSGRSLRGLRPLAKACPRP